MYVLGVLFLREKSCKEIYNDPTSGTIAMGSLYTSGFVLGLFEAYCTTVNTWGGLKEQFSIIKAMAKSPLLSFLAGFLGVIIFWAFFTLLGVIACRKRHNAISRIAAVTACATLPLSITLLFPILNYFGIKFIFGVDLGWLITLVAFVWSVIVEVRAIAAIL